MTNRDGQRRILVTEKLRRKNRISPTLSIQMSGISGKRTASGKFEITHLPINLRDSMITGNADYIVKL